MAIITELIGSQGFERVANRIGEILKEEISNQQGSQGFEENVKVFIERIEPFDKNEDVMISVAFREANYDGYTTRDVQGEYVYFIDLFTSAYAEQTILGDVQASIVAKNKLFRYSGLIRYILSSSKLLTLGFPPGLIGGKYIKKITFDTDYSNFGNHSNYDGSYIRFARFIYMVRVQENQMLWDGIPLEGNDTSISYETTNQGIKLVFNN